MPTKPREREKTLIRYFLSSYEHNSWANCHLDWLDEKKDGAVEVLATRSDGRRPAVEFARALALEPELLLLDEPAAGLNDHETDEVARITKKIRDSGVTVIIIEHDMSLIMDISDSILVLSSGKQIAEGKPSEIQRNKDVIDIYLGAENA